MTITKLSIVATGATEGELRRGLEAAAAVFRVSGVTPYAGAAAAFKREGEDIAFTYSDHENPPPETMTEREASAAAVWDEAQRAAVNACCAGWGRPADDAGIVLMREGEDPPGPVLEFEVDDEGRLK